MNIDNEKVTKIARAKPNMDIDFSFFRTEVPIEEVADILGIEVNKHGRFLCPCHNDTNPSAHLRPNGKNTWRCYTCGDVGGSPLDLVAAVEGISIRDAAFFLDRYFPGGISEKAKQETENYLSPPYISVEMLKKIGLKKNPFSVFNIKGQINIDNEKKDVFENKQLLLNLDDAANVVIDKLTEYINDRASYMEQLFAEFPKLDNSAKDYIKTIIASDINNAQTLLSTFREYVCNLAEQKTVIDINPWDVQEEREAL